MNRIMKRILSVLLVLLFSIISTLSIIAVGDTVILYNDDTYSIDYPIDNIENIEDYLMLSIRIKYLGIDKNYNVRRLTTNITTNIIGHMIYIENYYAGIDSSGEPKLYTSATHFDGTLTDNSISFDISRPRWKSGSEYHLVKGVIMMNGIVVFEDWIPIDKSYRFDTERPKQSHYDLVNDTAIDVVTFLGQSTDNVEKITSKELEGKELEKIKIYVDKTKYAQIFEIVAIILTIFIIYLSVRIKI